MLQLITPNEDENIGTEDNELSEWQVAMASDSFMESAEQQPAGYYRAASARARRLEAEVTTLKIKEYLRELIARYDRLAEEVERGCLTV
jgi:hypothetical protein